MVSLLHQTGRVIRLQRLRQIWKYFLVAVVECLFRQDCFCKQKQDCVLLVEFKANHIHARYDVSSFHCDEFVFKRTVWTDSHVYDIFNVQHSKTNNANRQKSILVNSLLDIYVVARSVMEKNFTYFISGFIPSNMLFLKMKNKNCTG